MTPVLFGKLPSHGDFVARGLAPAAAEQLDAAVAAGLDAARAALGEGFDDAHAAAPPWRFVAADEAGWRAGVLLPSADSAGRRFALLLAADGLTAAEAGALGANVAEHAEAVAYTAFAEELTADETLARLAQVIDLTALSAPAAASLGAEPRGSVWWTLGGETHLADVVAADAPTPDLFVRMLTPAAPARALQEVAA